MKRNKVSDASNLCVSETFGQFTNDSSIHFDRECNTNKNEEAHPYFIMERNNKSPKHQLEKGKKTDCSSEKDNYYGRSISRNNNDSRISSRIYNSNWNEQGDSCYGVQRRSLKPSDNWNRAKSKAYDESINITQTSPSKIMDNVLAPLNEGICDRSLKKFESSFQLLEFSSMEKRLEGFNCSSDVEETAKESFHLHSLNKRSENKYDLTPSKETGARPKTKVYNTYVNPVLSNNQEVSEDQPFTLRKSEFGKVFTVNQQFEKQLELSRGNSFVMHLDNLNVSNDTVTSTVIQKVVNSIRINPHKRNSVGSLFNSRECWSKACFSHSKHSHSTSVLEEPDAKRRDAILDSVSIHERQEKSFCLKMKDFWSSVKQFSEKFKIWNNTLKRIEGLHGTGVVSYFVFLRWLILLNLILFIITFTFITIPHESFRHFPFKKINLAPKDSVISEKLINQFPDSKVIKPKVRINGSTNLNNEDLLSDLSTYFNHYLPDGIIDITLYYDKRNLTFEELHNISTFCANRYRKEELSSPSDLLSSAQDFLQGTGWLQSTLLFLGYYSATEVLYFGYPYNIPVAVICVLFISFIFCLYMMVQYSSHGVQETILARNNYLIYSNILFCSWDYCIENKKSSIIRHKSIIHEIKSTLAEERRREQVQKWSKMLKTKVHCTRIAVNLFVLAMLCASYYLIYIVVNFQLKELQLHRLKGTGVQTLFVQYLTPIVITSLNIIVPIIFNAVVKYEKYDTQTQINVALIRIVFLRLSSVFVLVSLLYQQIICQPKDQCRSGMTSTCRSPICWETYVGQQLYKLVITDFIVYIALFFAYDLPRDLFVRCCKNKVTQMIGRQVFDLPNQVLALVYSQTLCWLGIIYSPLLPFLTVVKFIVLFYIKKLFVLKFCIPPPIPYKASRSNAMFIMILLLSFFAIMMIHGYSLSSLEPSPACSPFRYYFVMVDAVPDAIYSHSAVFMTIINFIFSGVFLFPAIILLCIAIYYYWTIVIAHRKMVKLLKAQIVLEGRDKQFLLNRLTHIAKGHLD